MTIHFRNLVITGALITATAFAGIPTTPLQRAMDGINASVKAMQSTIKVNHLNETSRSQLQKTVADFQRNVTEARDLAPDAVKTNPSALQKWEAFFDALTSHSEAIKTALAVNNAQSVDLGDVEYEISKLLEIRNSAHAMFRPSPHH